MAPRDESARRVRARKNLAPVEGASERRADVPDPAFARRVVVEGVRPQVDGGRFPVKRVLGDTVEVRANVFADGHDLLVVILRDRPILRDGAASAGAKRG